MRGGLAGVAMALVLAGCTPTGHGPGGPGVSGMGTMYPDPTRPTYLNPGTPAALPGFTSVIRNGNSVFVSGQVALNDSGAVVGAGDLAAQARQAFYNLTRVLEIAGAIPTEVLRLNIFVVNLKAGDWDIIRQEGAAFLPVRNPPAGTLVGVQSLPRDGLLIAIDASAVIRAQFRPKQ